VPDFHDPGKLKRHLRKNCQCGNAKLNILIFKELIMKLAMKIVTQTTPITVAGISIRTSNAKAFEEIPLLWKTFFEKQILSAVPDKVNDDIYAVYTEYDRIPQNADDIYSLSYTFIIGAAVNRTDRLPSTLVSTIVPASKRAVFPIEQAKPELVGAEWQKIWQMQDLLRAFAPDYEHYSANGDINILVSLS
jgi:predicted transcriptional regulator YdeE